MWYCSVEPRTTHPPTREVYSTAQMRITTVVTLKPSNYANTNPITVTILRVYILNEDRFPENCPADAPGNIPCSWHLVRSQSRLYLGYAFPNIQSYTPYSCRLHDDNGVPLAHGEAIPFRYNHAPGYTHECNYVRACVKHTTWSSHTHARTHARTHAPTHPRTQNIQT